MFTACTAWLHGVAAQRGAVVMLKRPSSFGKRRAGGGNNHCGCHVWFFGNAVARIS